MYFNRFFKVGGSVRNAVQGLSLAGAMVLMIAGCTTMPVAKPGDPIYHIAALSQMNFNRIKRRLEEHAEHPVFNLVHEHLATSLHEME